MPPTRTMGRDRGRYQHSRLRSPGGFAVSRRRISLRRRACERAIVTHPRIYAPPTPLGRALDQVDAWYEAPTLTLLAESTMYWPALRALLAAGRVTGPRVHDARIAALCREHGVRELWSADRDFSRFSELAVVNPLARAP